MAVRPLLAALAAIVVGLGVASCGADDGAEGGSGSQFVAGDSAVTLVPADERGAPVDLSGTTLAGGALDLASLRGDVVVLNVWGSWCAPCRKEAPELQAASEQLAPAGTSFLGINVRDPDPAPALAFERRFGVTYPSLVDSDGRLLLALRGAVPPSAIPTTLVLDQQGRVAARVNGATTTRTIVALVEDVAAEQP